MRRILLLILCSVMLAAAGCVRPEPARQPRQDEKRFTLRGTVLSVDAAAKTVTIAHEDIPNFMDAMTMGFKLKDDADYARLQRGDRVEATLVLRGSDSYLESLSIARPPQGAAALPDQPPAAGARPGDAVPDVRLVNHDGKTFRFSQLRGKTVVLTFIYTRCPLPNYCPLMNRNLASIAKALDPEPQRARAVHLLSVSFDPEYDTPAVLRKSREAFRPSGSQLSTPWDFATGQPADIRKLAVFFGVTYEGSGTNITHNLRTAVIGPDGKVVRVFNGNTWQPSEVLAVLSE